MLQLLLNSGCTNIDPSVIAALITTVGTLAGIALKEWLDERKRRSKQGKGKPVAQRYSRILAMIKRLPNVWKSLMSRLREWRKLWSGNVQRSIKKKPLNGNIPQEQTAHSVNRIGRIYQ